MRALAREGVSIFETSSTSVYDSLRVPSGHLPYLFFYMNFIFLRLLIPCIPVFCFEQKENSNGPNKNHDGHKLDMHIC